MLHVFHHRAAWLVCLTFLSLSATGCGSLSITIGGATRGVDSTVVQEDKGWHRNRVAIIDVSGMIVNGRRSGILSAGEHPLSFLHEQLRRAEEDSRVKAVILRINSPGGTVTASDAMYREVLRFKQRTGKPVVTMMMDVAASGGYYLACASDHIVAYPSTITGSIGVILQTVSVKPLMDKIGVEATAITSGPNKAAGSPLEDLSDDHRKLLQGLVDDFYERFVSIVRERRAGIPKDKFGSAVDGRVFTGSQAKAMGLVDELGEVYDAWAAAKRLAGIERADLISYHRPNHEPGSAYAITDVPTGQAATQVNLAQLNITGVPMDRVGFYYVWRPQWSE